MQYHQQAGLAGPRPGPRRRRRRSRRARVAALVAAVAIPATAAAQSEPDPDPHHAAIGTAEADAVDLALIAADTGWSPAATKRHLADQAAFGALVDQVVSRFPESFAGAELAEAPGGTSYLRFKGSVPDEARALAAGSGLAVELTGGRTYSAAQLAQRAVAVVRHFADAGYTQAGAAVLPTGRIEASVTGTARPGTEPPVALRDGVRVTFADHPVARDLHTDGGAYIHGATSECTSGFSVESLLTSETGVATAAHCTGMNHYHQPQSATTYDLVWEDQHVGASGDVEWHTTANSDHIELAEYYADPTDLRQVNSVETSAAVNNTYCVYSRRQGTRTCDQVWSTYVVMLTSAGLASNLVGMDDTNAVAGDSGGPWSYSTEAAGIVKGTLWVPFANHDTWTKAWAFDSAVDVEVMT